MTAADRLSAFLRTTPSLARVLSGESPARFRRRVLLERAAYAMRSTHRTLLDIALDSGFTGQATFANAFRAEFGVLPSVWRADPTSHLIDSASDVHFHPPARLRLPARHRIDGVDLVVAMAEHHVVLVGGLVDRVGAVPEDALDHVPEAAEVPTLCAALSLLVDRMERVSAAVHDADHDPDHDADHDPGPGPGHEQDGAPASVRRRLDRVGPAFVAAVSRIAATGRFDETFVDAFSTDPHETSFGALVAEVLTGGDHHRLHDRLHALATDGDDGR